MTALHDLSRRLMRGSSVLTWTGIIHATLAIIALALMPFDERTILGVDPWLKPFKFMVSLAVYEWTLAWILSEVGSRGRSERIIAWGASLAMLGETVCLWLQSARGTTSHFNQSSAFDGVVFAVMGLLIMINTLFAAWLFVLVCVRRTPSAPAARWGLRLGLGVFLLGSMLGWSMIVTGAHSVGVPDGGPGLPLVNWSTEGGDLRIAHALGLHALQLFPLIGYALASRNRSARWFLLVLPVWLALIAGLYMKALSGRPLWTAVATSEAPDRPGFQYRAAPRLPALGFPGCPLAAVSPWPGALERCTRVPAASSPIGKSPRVRTGRTAGISNFASGDLNAECTASWS